MKGVAKIGNNTRANVRNSIIFDNNALAAVPDLDFSGGTSIGRV